MILSNYNGKLLKDLKDNIKIGDYKLDLVNEFKYLGLVMDERLKFESHIKSIKQSVMCRLVTFKNIRHLIERREALLLYKSYILRI